MRCMRTSVGMTALSESNGITAMLAVPAFLFYKKISLRPLTKAQKYIIIILVIYYFVP